MGAFDLVDNDKVCLTNLNRQIIATRKTVGKYKVDVMRERMLEINPDCDVRVRKCFYLPETAAEFNFSDYDYVVDAVDTVTAKVTLVLEAQKAGVPIISCMGAGNKLDPSRFRVADIYKTQGCPLARVMRTALRKRGVKKLKVVYSDEIRAARYPRQHGLRAVGRRAHHRGRGREGSVPGMKKTYVTTVPNHIGAFLSASRLLAALDVNITRVSYNKAVDSHTIFIEAEGSRQQLAQADEQLAAIGYLRSGGAEKSVVLLEFQLRDVPGGVTDILACIERFGFNISYLSSQENGTDYQLFKMGLFVEDPARIHAFLREARALCPVRVIDYDRAEKTFDNSIFYDSFVSGLCRAMDLPESARPSLLVNANLAMQTLDERGLSPYRTFDSIRRFAELLSQSRGERFLPRVTNCRLTDETALTLIEPPCGSNTAILTHGEDVLFIDSGYACYRPEMLTLFRRLVPNFDARKKTILITHADVDHCGLLPEFDEVLLSAKSAASAIPCTSPISRSANA